MSSSLSTIHGDIRNVIFNLLYNVLEQQLLPQKDDYIVFKVHANWIHLEVEKQMFQPRLDYRPGKAGSCQMLTGPKMP